MVYLANLQNCKSNFDISHKKVSANINSLNGNTILWQVHIYYADAMSSGSIRDNTTTTISGP